LLFLSLVASRSGSRSGEWNRLRVRRVLDEESTPAAAGTTHGRMTISLRLVLLIFAAIGFTGAGASLAVARKRRAHELETDYGMLAVAAMLLIFAVLCTTVSSGLSGVLAFGGVAVWASYLVTAQRLELFRIEVKRYEEPAMPGPRQRT
jgi:hypothetical protein